MNNRLLSNHLLGRMTFLALVSASSLLSSEGAKASNATWTGSTSATNTDWATGANWGGTAPVTGQGLVFGTAGANGATLTNSLTTQAFNVAGITFNAGGSAFTFGGNTFTLTGGIVNSGTQVQTFNNTGGLFLNLGSSTWTIGGGLAITNGLTNSSNAAETITANGTSAGALTLGSFTLNSGAASVTDVINGSGQVSVTGGVTNGGAGTSGLTYSGTGTLSLAGASSYTGTLTVSSGVVNATTAGLNGSSTTSGIALGGGTLQAGAGGIATAKAVAVTGSSTFDTDGAGSTLSGNVTGSGTFTVANSSATAGSLTLAGSGNTFSGGLIITDVGGTGNTVVAGNANSGVLGSGTVNMGDNTTLDLGDNSPTVLGLSTAAGTGTNASITNATGGTARNTLTLNNANNTTFAGVISDGTNTGGLGLTLTSGTQTLSGANTYSGPTTLNGGTLNTTSLAAAGSASGIGAGNSTSTATNQASLVFGSGTLTYTGASSASSNRLFTIGNASGTSATINANNSTAANTVSFTNTGTIALADNGTTYTHTLTLGGTNTGVNLFAPAIADFGAPTSLNVNSSVAGGTWALSNANTFSGTTTISGSATLQLNNTKAVQNSVVSLGVANGLTYNATGAYTVAGLTGSSNEALGSGDILNIGTFFNNNSNTYSGVLSGAGGVGFFGLGTQIFSGANTYSGGTTITEGNVSGLASTLGVLKSTDPTTATTPFGTGAITINGGTLSLSPSGSSSTLLSDTGASASNTTQFTYGGGSFLVLAKGTNTGGLTFTVGGASPSVSVLNRTNNGVLIIQPGTTGDLGTGASGENFVVTGTAPATTQAAGGGPASSVNASIVGLGAVTANMGDFLTYGANGFASDAANYTSLSTTTYTAPTSSQIAYTTASGTFTTTATAGALIVKNGVTSTIGTGATLTVGDNTSGHQAGIILNGGANLVGAAAGAAGSYGTLNFGADEGIIYSFDATNYIGAVVTGTGGLTLAGNQVIYLQDNTSNTNHANTFTGGINIESGANLGISNRGNGGTFQQQDTDLGNINNVITLNGGGITASAGYVGLGRSLVVGSDGGELGGNENFAFNISGSGLLTINSGSAHGTPINNYGNAFSFLSGNNSGFSGGMLLYEGAAIVASPNALGTGTITFDGGFLSIAGTSMTSIANTLNYTPGVVAGIDVQAASNSITLSQPIANGTGGFDKLGVGTLVLTGVSNYTGQTQLYGGTLQVNESTGALYSTNTGVTSAGTLYFDGGTLDVVGSGAGTTTQNFGNLTMGSNNATSDVTMGGGTLIGDNNGANLNVNLGTLAMSSSAGTAGAIINETTSQTGNALAVVAKGSGTTTFTTTTAPDGSSGSGGYGIYGGRVVYVTENSAGAITGVNWATSNSLSSPYTLTGYNNYSSFNADNGSDNGNNDQVTGASTTLGGQTTVNSLKINNSSAGTFNLAGNNLTFASGGLLFTGSSNYTIQDSVGGGTINSAMLSSAQTGGGSNPGSDFVVQQYGSGTLTISAPITDYFNSALTTPSYVASTLTKAGPGTLVLGAQGYTGRTFIDGGVLSISSDAGIGGNNGALAGVTSSTLSSVVTSTAAALPFGFGPGSTFLGQTVNSVTGSSGAWTINLAGSAGTTLANGTAAYWTTQQVSINGGTLQVTGNDSMEFSNSGGNAGTASPYGAPRSVAIGFNGATFNVTNGSELFVGNLDSAVGGSDAAADGGITITSSDNSQGTVVINHLGNNGGGLWTGPLTISNATVRIGSSGSFGQGNDLGQLGFGGAADTYVTLTGTGHLQLAGNTQAAVAGLVSSSTTSVLESGFGATSNTVFNIVNGDNETFAGTVENTSSIGTGNLSLVKGGSGSLTFSGNNTYTGYTVVFDGALTAGSTHAFGTNSSVTILNSANASLNLNGYSNTIGSLASGNDTIGGNLTSSLGGVNLGSGTATLTLGGDNTDPFFAGVISGSGSLAKIGTGTQTLTSAETYSGGSTAVNNGALVSTLATSGAPFGGSGVAINGGTLSLAPTGSGAIADTGATASGAQLTYGGNSTLAVSLLNGTATSLSYTVGSGSGSAFNRANGGDLVIQFDPTVTGAGTTSAAYNNATATTTNPTAANGLGTSESVLVASGNTTLGLVHGMVSPTIVGSIGGNSTNITSATVAGVTSGTGSASGTITQAVLPTNLVVGDTFLGQTIIALTTGSTTGTWLFTLAGNANTSLSNGVGSYVVPNNTSLTLGGVYATTSTSTVTATSLPSSFGVGATLLGQTVTGITAASGTFTITLSGSANANVGTATVGAAATFTTPATGAFLTYGSNGFTTLPSSSYTTTAGTISSALPADEIANVNAAATFNTASNQVYALTVQKGITATITGVTLTVGDNNGAQAGVILNGGTISGTGTLSFGSDEGLIYGFNSTGTLTAALAGTGGVTYGGNQAIVLGSANTYSGATTINGATLNVTTVANGGAASDSLGTSSNAAGNLVFNGGTLSVTPTAAVSTNRLFTIGSGGATINNNSGTAANTLTFSNTGAIVISGNYGNQSLTLGGSNTGNNLFTPIIADASAGNTTSLIKSGAGLWILNGANTYTGGTTINTGTLQINTGGNLGSGGVLDNGGLTYNQAGTLTESNIISGSGTITQVGTGTTVLTAANLFSGTTTVTTGVLQLGNANALYNSALTVNANGGLTFSPGIGTSANGGGVSTLGVFNLKSLAGTGNITLQDTLGNAAYIDFGGPYSVAPTNSGATYSGVFSGSGGLLKYGTGTEILSGTNSSYTGLTEIDGNNGATTGGGLSVASLALGGSNSSIGASTNAASNLVFGAGSLIYTGAGSTTDRLFTIGDANGSSASIYANGTGALNFSNSAGSIAFGSTANSVFVNLAGNRTLYLRGTSTAANSFAPILGDYTAASTPELTNLVKEDAGTWDITGVSNTYTGPTDIDGGILNVASLTTEGASGGTASSIGASANSAFNLTFGGGTLQYTGATTQTTDRLFSLGDGIVATATGTIDASGTGGAALVFNNTGYIGQYASASSNASLTLTGSTTGTNSLASVYTDNNIAGKTSNLTKAGTDVWAITSTSNSYSGTTSVDGGTLNVASVAPGGVTTTVSTGAKSATTITVASTAGLSIGEAVTGAGIAQGATISNISGLVVTLSLPNIGTVTAVTAGTGNSLGISTNVASNLIFNGGALQYTGSTAQTTDRLFTIGDASSTTNSATLDASGTGAGTLSFTNAGSIAFGGTAGAHTLNLIGTNTGSNTLASVIGDQTALTQTTKLVKNGAGLWVLTGADTYTGGTTITAGTLQIGAGGTAGSLSSTGTITDNGTLTFDLSSAAVQGTQFSTAAITGSGGITQIGTGTVTLNAANSYSGTTTITHGTLALSGSGTTGATTSSMLINGGVFDLNGVNDQLGALTLGQGAAGSTIQTSTGTPTLTTSGVTVNGSGVNTIGTGVTVTGAISQSASTALTVNGNAGSDTLASSATLAGTGTLGAVSLAGSNTLSSTGTLTTTGITVSGTGNSISSGTVSGGSGGTSLNGTGTVALGVTGTLSGSGGVIIGTGTNNATLTLNTGGGISGPVTVNSGSILAVTGSGTNAIAGSLTIAGGGTVNLQNGAVNTLDPTTLAVTGNGTLDLDLGSTGADQLVFSSTNSFSGNHLTINLDALSGATTGTYTFISGFTGGTLTLADFSLGSFNTTADPSLAADLFSIIINPGGNSASLDIMPATAPVAYFNGTGADLATAANYYTTAGGSTPISAAPSAVTDVYLTSNNGTTGGFANTPTLNSALAINSLTFTGTGTPAAAGVNLTGTGTLTIEATTTTSAGGTNTAPNGITVQTGAGNDTIGVAVALGASQSWTVTDATNTLTVSGQVSDGGHSYALTKAGAGALALSGSNTYSGGTTVSAGTLLASNTTAGGSATGTGSLTVNAGATLGGYGTSSGTGFSISGTGTTTGARANVLAGLNSATDTSVATTLTLKGSAAGTISNANLTFNLNSTVAGGLGTNPANSGTELAVGATPITFGLGTQSTILSLNFSYGIVGAYTPYVLVAGLTTGGADQYTNLSLGTPTGTLASGLITPILNSNFGGMGNLTLSMSGTAAGFYGGNSYLFLYQNSTTGADDIEVEVVPEPGTWALMLGGLAVLIVWQRRKNKMRP